MKIIYKTGDVTKATEPVIAHGCNSLGRMGAGVAFTIRNTFPLAYIVYQAAHEEIPLVPGEVIYAKCDGKHIANLIIQSELSSTGKRRVVDYEALYKALEDLNAYTEVFKFNEVAFPRIGAGLAGGDWNIISTMIEVTSKSYQPVVYDL